MPTSDKNNTRERSFSQSEDWMKVLDNFLSDDDDDESPQNHSNRSSQGYDPINSAPNHNAGVNVASANPLPRQNASSVEIGDASSSANPENPSRSPTAAASVVY